MEGVKNVKKKKKSKAGKIIIWIVLILTIGVFIFAGGKVLSILLEYNEAASQYRDIEDIFDDNKTIEETTEEIDPFDYDVPFEYDYDKLRAQYPDAIGWIYLKDRFSYPIFQEKEGMENFYLYHLPDGTYNVSGSLFVQKEFPEGMKGTYSIVYGHNMNDGSMFGRLHSYHNQSNFEKQSRMHVFIEYDHYVYNVIGTFETGVDSKVYETHNLDTKEVYDDFVDMVVKNREYEIPLTEMTYQKNQIITLSTCTTSLSGYYRYVVVIARDHKVKEKIN